MVEIHDRERGSYEQQQQNCSDGKHNEGNEPILSHDIMSPFEGIICQYCNMKRCICCSYETNYYYNYGLSRRKIRVCTDCYIDVFGHGSRIPAEIVTNAFSKICETIKNSTTVTSNLSNQSEVNYFDAVRRAFNTSQDVRTYLGENCKIDKNLRRLWSFTYKIVNGREKGIDVLSRDPDNLILTIVYKKICLSS